nr:retrovirus-related Pol polyprotein from transposon TNT 1-94 [Tanacetum cinerariifolium]
LNLHHGDNVFDCTVEEKKMGLTYLSQLMKAHFQMGTFRETITEGEEGALHLGPDRARVYSNLSPEAKESCALTLNTSVITKEKTFTITMSGSQDNAVDEDVDEPPVQDLALNVDNVFQADECDAFDSDVDEAPTVQTMLMANISSAYPVYDEVGPSYDSDLLSEVYDHDNYQDVVCEHHEVHEMHDDVQPNCVVNSDVEYMGDSNMIPYDRVTNNTIDSESKVRLLIMHQLIWGLL